jgi:hypothetical protein
MLGINRAINSQGKAIGVKANQISYQQHPQVIRAHNPKLKIISSLITDSRARTLKLSELKRGA